MNLAKLTRLRRQQRIRAAEGYLELISACVEHWHPSPTSRDRLATTALELLSDLSNERHAPGHIDYLRGQLLRAMERYDEAIDALRRAAQDVPENFHVQLALGWCFKRVDRIDLAIDALEDAIDFAPDHAIIHYNLACYWSLRGSVRQALTYLMQAFEIDPNYRDLVACETDFDPIRDNPEFRLLTSVIV